MSSQKHSARCCFDATYSAEFEHKSSRRYVTYLKIIFGLIMKNWQNYLYHRWFVAFRLIICSPRWSMLVLKEYWLWAWTNKPLVRRTVFSYPALHKICENTGFHWPVFFRIRTEYTISVNPYSRIFSAVQDRYYQYDSEFLRSSYHSVMM